MNNFIWNNQKENDIYWSWNDWDLHYFACVLNNGLCIVYTGIIDESFDGESIRHLEPVEDYHYGVDDIAMWTEMPRNLVINNKQQNKLEE